MIAFTLPSAAKLKATSKSSRVPTIEPRMVYSILLRLIIDPCVNYRATTLSVGPLMGLEHRQIDIRQHRSMLELIHVHVVFGCGVRVWVIKLDAAQREPGHAGTCKPTFRNPPVRNFVSSAKS